MSGIQSVFPGLLVLYVPSRTLSRSDVCLQYCEMNGELKSLVFYPSFSFYLYTYLNNYLCIYLNIYLSIFIYIHLYTYLHFSFLYFLLSLSKPLSISLSPSISLYLYLYTSLPLSLTWTLPIFSHHIILFLRHSAGSNLSFRNTDSSSELFLVRCPWVAEAKHSQIFR